MKLKNLLLAPPGGWKYFQTETGFWMSAITFETLLRRVSAHRNNNNLPQVNPPFETLAAEIENAICQRLTLKEQGRKCQTGIRYKDNVHFSEVVDFFKSNVAFFASGKEQVDVTEAERRASICSTCPLNVAVVGCAVCQKAIKEYRDRVAGLRPTSKDAQIKACGVCGCDLKTIVHFPHETLREKSDHNFPDWCWQKRGGVNEIFPNPA